MWLGRPPIGSLTVKFFKHKRWGLHFEKMLKNANFFYPSFSLKATVEFFVLVFNYHTSYFSFFLIMNVFFMSIHFFSFSSFKNKSYFFILCFNYRFIAARVIMFLCYDGRWHLSLPARPYECVERSPLTALWHRVENWLANFIHKSFYIICTFYV